MNILIFFLSILLFSCAPRINLDPVKTLHQHSPRIAHFDPQLTTDLASLLFVAKSYESLLEADPLHPPFGLLPNLAQDMPQVDQSGTLYTFKLRQNVTFHPCPCFNNGLGRQVTAQDFITSFKRLADPKIKSPHYSSWEKRIVGLKEWHELQLAKDKTDYSIPITGLSAPTPYTLTVKAIRPDLYFSHYFTAPSVAPIPIEAIDFFQNNFAQHMVGTGPFILQENNNAALYTFIKNPQFRSKYFPGSDPKDNKRVPFVEKIMVHVLEATQTAWTNFLKGKIDYLEIPKDNFESAINFSAQIDGQHKITLSPEFIRTGINIGITNPDNNIYYVGINNKNTWTKDRKFRQALAYSIDYHKFNQLFFNQTALLAHGLIPSTLPFNQPPSPSPYLCPLDNKEKCLQEHRQEAKKLLQEIHFPLGEKSPSLQLAVRDSTLARQIGEFLQQQFASIGVRIVVDTMPIGHLIEKAQKGKTDFYYLAWFTGIPTGFEFFDLTYGKNWPESYNRCGYQNSAFDQLYEQAEKSLDQKKQFNYWRKMNSMMIDDVPIIPLVHARDFFAHQIWLKNYFPSETAAGAEQYMDIDQSLKEKYLNLR